MFKNAIFQIRSLIRLDDLFLKRRTRATDLNIRFTEDVRLLEHGQQYVIIRVSHEVNVFFGFRINGPLTQTGSKCYFYREYPLL